MKKIFFIVVLCAVSLSVSAKGDIQFKFNKEGKFKIAQFTDVHWIHESTRSDKSVETIKAVLKAEKPDIAILTGDIVWKADAKEAWPNIVRIFEEAKQPFAVIFGNHDSEVAAKITRAEIFDLFLSKSPYFVGEKGPEDIHGCGNYVIPVLNSKSKTAALIYCLDSNESSIPYSYEPVHFDQVLWYRQQSDKYTQLNNGKPLPSLAFFHIPLLEYNRIAEKPTLLGTKGEGIASSQLNSGLFNSFVEKKDVMGIFVGHDHNNDYIDIDFNIAMAFGRVTGVDAYGNLERGSRIIELNENDFSFDTWIRTPTVKELEFYYPSGITSVDEKTMTYLPAKEANPKKHGVNYSYYEGDLKSFADLDTMKKVKEGVLKKIAISEATVADKFAYEFRTLIKIPERGVYNFYTQSDDWSILSIDGELLIDNSLRKRRSKIEKKIALEAGFHELKVLFYENVGDEFLDVGYSTKTVKTQTLPDNCLYVIEH